jgi:hypothetical protein
MGPIVSHLVIFVVSASHRVRDQPNPNTADYRREPNVFARDQDGANENQNRAIGQVRVHVPCSYARSRTLLTDFACH